MLKIRMQRVGRKHEPIFRLVLTDSQNGPKSGKFLEILGSYDSRKAEDAQFNAEKIKHWMSKGALLSDTTHNLLVKKGLIEGKKINILPKKIIEAAKKPKEIPVPVAEKIEAQVEENQTEEQVTEEKVEEDKTETTEPEKE